MEDTFEVAPSTYIWSGAQHTHTKHCFVFTCIQCFCYFTSAAGFVFSLLFFLFPVPFSCCCFLLLHVFFFFLFSYFFPSSSSSYFPFASSPASSSLLSSLEGPCRVDVLLSNVLALFWHGFGLVLLLLLLLLLMCCWEAWNRLHLWFCSIPW